MKILVVAATAFECRLDIGSKFIIGEPVKVIEPFNQQIDVLVTGVGAVPTAFALTRCIQNYDLILNIGIAGSYSLKYSIGSVVCISMDAFGDYGIDNRGTFKPLSELNFVGNVLYSSNPFMNNPWMESKFSFVKMPNVKGLTLSTASGSDDIINKIKGFWGADIETMEGASVFYVCNQLDKPFICFRAISNMVEPRDKSNWDTDKAIGNLDKELRHFIQCLD